LDLVQTLKETAGDALKVEGGIVNSIC